MIMLLRWMAVICMMMAVIGWLKSRRKKKKAVMEDKTMVLKGERR